MKRVLSIECSTSMYDLKFIVEKHAENVYKTYELTGKRKILKDTADNFADAFEYAVSEASFFI